MQADMARTPVLCRHGDGPVYQVVSHPTRCILAASDTGGAFSLFEITCPPADGAPPHTHTTEDETFIVLDGELVITIAGAEHTLRPGDVAFGPRGVQHRFENRTDRPVRFLLIATPGGLERFFAEVDRDFGHGQPFSPERFMALIRKHRMLVD